LVDGFDIEIFPYSASQSIEVVALGKILLATSLLIQDPLLRLR
jgi:hypothetical protein